jgi:hypothetical protein
MANPLFNTFGNKNNPYSNIIAEAKRFKASFSGNPQQEVQKLLNSGAMTQAQFNELSQIAQQVIQAMGGDF